MKVEKVSQQYYRAECQAGNVFVSVVGTSMIEAIRYALLEIYEPYRAY